MEYTHTVHEASRRQTKQRHILGALRAGQRRLLANVSALSEINLGEAREALDASVERLARLAAEQDATRMRTVGERSREQRRAIADVVQPYEAPFVWMGLRVGFVDRPPERPFAFWGSPFIRRVGPKSEATTRDGLAGRSPERQL